MSHQNFRLRRLPGFGWRFGGRHSDIGSQVFSYWRWLRAAPVPDRLRSHLRLQSRWWGGWLCARTGFLGKSLGNLLGNAGYALNDWRGTGLDAVGMMVDP